MTAMEQNAYCQIVSKMKKYSVETYLDKSFSELTTLGCGGKIKITIYPDGVKKLIKCVRLLDRLKVTYCILGRGSNVLCSDDVYDGVVVVTTKMKAFRVRGKYAYALAGASTVTLGNALKNKGLTGGEFLACLPATVGGAVVTNAGCYGQQIDGVVKSVKALLCGKVKRLSAKQCKFGKRKSLFSQNDGYVILSVKLKFARSTPQQVSEKINEMRAKKSATQPLNFRSAGSALYHDKVAVSRLIDEAGLKGYTVGGAQVSERHAGFVINIDKATSKDIYLVIRHMQRTLRDRFGLDAKIEIRLINFTEDSTKDGNDFFPER